MRRVLSALLAIGLVAAGLFFAAPRPRVDEVAVTGAPAHGTDGPAVGGAATVPDAAPPETAERESAARSDPTKAVPAFECVDEDGQAIADAVRDGIVVEVREADGRACADCPIDVMWRKGFGVYGHDRGRTAADGTFATTVAVLQMFEVVTLHHPKFGKLSKGDYPLLAPGNGRRAVYVVPHLAELRFVVRDLAGAPHGGVDLKVTTSTPEPLGLCDNLLATEVSADDATRAGEPTTAEGRTSRFAPLGVVEVEVRCGAKFPLLRMACRVPLGGGEIDLVVPRMEARDELRISVACPDAAGAVQRVEAWGQDAVPAPRSPLVLVCDWQRRDFETREDGDGIFVARVDPLPLRVSATSANGWHALADVRAGQREVTLILQAPPAEPVAELAVTVTRADGATPVLADVRVHETPDLDPGAREMTDVDGKLLLRLPASGKKVCVSAKVHELPYAIAGPFELRPGRQEVALQLVAGGTIEGAVVDADGKPVAADVVLRRPAGALRELVAGSPEILPITASGDSRSVGEGETFGFTGIGAGPHEIWAFPQAAGLPARATATAGETLTMRLGHGCDDVVLLAVEVRDADSGELLPNSRLQPLGALYSASRGKVPGTFAIPVRAEAVELEVMAVDHAMAHIRHAPRRGDGPLAVRLEPSPLRFVRILDERGIGMHSLRLQVFDAAGASVDFLDENANERGSFAETDLLGCVVLRGLPRGACRIVAAVKGNSDDARQRREFVLPAGAGITSRFELVWK